MIMAALSMGHFTSLKVIMTGVTKYFAHIVMSN